MSMNSGECSNPCEDPLCMEHTPVVEVHPVGTEAELEAMRAVCKAAKYVVLHVGFDEELAKLSSDVLIKTLIDLEGVQNEQR